jgi:hypothetical protein
MLERVKAFRCTILAQFLLLALGWVCRDGMLCWWCLPFSDWWQAQKVIVHDWGGLSWRVELGFVLLTSWVVLAPIAASEAWVAGRRWAGRPAAFRQHWGFALATGCVVLGSALATRQLSIHALELVLL